MSAPLLQMQDVFKRVPGKYALNGLDFSVPSGQVVGLLGRNGAGKTTLLECALGLRDIERGEIRLFGETPAQMTDANRARIGYVPQQTDLFEWLSVPQMLAFFKAFYPRWNDAKVDALTQRWSIPLTVPIGRLSVGEKQRLAIIRALAHDPEFLILDEPVASLDPAGRRDFLRELVERTIERETTVVFSTHILSDLERVAADVAFMREGKIILRQPLDVLEEQTRRLVGPATALPIGMFGEELARKVDTSGVANILARLSEPERILASSLAAQGVRNEAVGLEDLFIEATQ